MNSHALNVLEYRDALELVARNASSALGADAVRALEPSADLGWIESELARVEEMRAFLGGGDGWALPALPDVREPVRRLRIEGSVLEAAQLRDLGTLLGSSRSTRRAVLADGGAERFPLLALLADGLVEAEKDEAAIGRAIDESGDVRDDASPELSRLRREITLGARAASSSGWPPSAARCPTTTGGRRLGHGARRALRDPGPARGARRGGRHRARRDRHRRHALRRAAGGDRDR